MFDTAVEIKRGVNEIPVNRVRLEKTSRKEWENWWCEFGRGEEAHSNRPRILRLIDSSSLGAANFRRVCSKIKPPAPGESRAIDYHGVKRFSKCFLLWNPHLPPPRHLHPVSQSDNGFVVFQPSLPYSISRRLWLITRSFLP